MNVAVFNLYLVGLCLDEYAQKLPHKIRPIHCVLRTKIRQGGTFIIK